MSKRLSKTLAAEIADRTLEVVNPQNRAIALSAALRRHGFAATSVTEPNQLTDRAALLAWLLDTYAPRD